MCNYFSYTILVDANVVYTVYQSSYQALHFCVRHIIMYDVSFLDMTCRSKEFNSFLHKCLTKNPETRSSATELLQHPFVASVSHHRPLRALYQVRITT